MSAAPGTESPRVEETADTAAKAEAAVEFARWAVGYAARAAVASPPGTPAGVLRGDLALVAARAEIALRGGPRR